jgi:hypothetical protein
VLTSIATHASVSAAMLTAAVALAVAAPLYLVRAKVTEPVPVLHGGVSA